MTTCFVFGGSGAIGRQLLIELNRCESVEKILSFGRRSIFGEKEEGTFSKIQEYISNNLEELLQNYSNSIKPSVAFCCIGSKGDKNMLEYVELILVKMIATFCEKEGVREFHLVTGFGSNPLSRFEILRIKGKSEELVKEIGFDRLFIYQPGLLRCIRDKDDVRPCEYIARKISDVLDFGNWWSVHVRDVALVMVLNSFYRYDQEVSDQIINVLKHRDIVDRSRKYLI